MRTPTFVLTLALMAAASSDPAQAQVRLIVESPDPDFSPDALRAALAERTGVDVFGLDPARGVAIEIMLDMADESARASFRTVTEPHGRVVELSLDDTLIERLAAIVERARAQPQIAIPSHVRGWTGDTRNTAFPLLRAWPLRSLLGTRPESGTILARPPPSR